MENSIELTSTHSGVDNKKRKVKGKYIKSVDFPYKAKQLFGLGGNYEKK